MEETRLDRIQDFKNVTNVRSVNGYSSCFLNLRGQQRFIVRINLKVAE
jgi:hypothetical protein